MKRILTLFSITSALAISFYPTTSSTQENSSPVGKTDSPMDGVSCVGYHNPIVGTVSYNYNKYYFYLKSLIVPSCL